MFFDIREERGDLLEMKLFEPAMRHWLDMYIRADDSEVLMDFEELGLIVLVVQNGIDGLEHIKRFSTLRSSHSGDEIYLKLSCASDARFASKSHFI